jgi:tetratricopeptide (TPR) repeat protein
MRTHHSNARTLGTPMRTLTLAIALALVAAPLAAVDAARLAAARSKAAKGDKALAKGQFVDAEALYRDAIASEPSLPTSYEGLGAALIGQLRFADALPVLEQAKTRYLNWEKLANMTSLEKQSDAQARSREIDDMDTAQKSKGAPTVTSGSTMGGLASGALDTEKFLAKRGLDTDTIKPIPAQVFYYTGLALLRTGQRDQGIEELTVCLARDGAHGLAHYNLAVALFSKGDVAGAKQHLDAALKAGVKAHPKFVQDVEAASAGK